MGDPGYVTKKGQKDVHPKLQADTHLKQYAHKRQYDGESYAYDIQLSSSSTQLGIDREKDASIGLNLTVTSRLGAVIPLGKASSMGFECHRERN